MPHIRSTHDNLQGLENKIMLTQPLDDSVGYLGSGVTESSRL